MDAKPQRPYRTFKVRDENMPPTLPPSKTIHHRNKSSPALSTLASQQGAGLRPGTRRAAFADVSNTSRVNQAAKDDLALAGTKATLVSLKEVNSEQENSVPTALARPAQRPISVSGISRFLHNFASGSSTTTKASTVDANTELHHPAPLRRAKSKKSTAVLRDVVEEPQASFTHHNDPSLDSKRPEPINCQSDKPSYSTVSRPGSDDLPAPVTSLSGTEEDPAHKLPPLPTSSSDFVDIRSDGAPLYPDHDHRPLPSIPTSSFDSKEIYVDAASYIPEAQSDHAAPASPPLPSSSLIPTQAPHVSNLDPLFELDEHMQREPYQDHYEDDGYTTARSLKSKGDYTTGATTVLLAPRVTAQVEKEIASARVYMEKSKAIGEIEEDESWDTSMVAEYGDEIFEYMHSMEERMRPNPYYMDKQTEVQWSMRSVLMDWLIQVHHRFGLLPETLFLCVNYIDRFLSAKIVSINKLQLVGATAILVAAKYEEIQCPSISEIQYMVESSYKVDEILKAERFMLTMLKFELGWPGPMSFLRRISKADDYDLETRTLAKYFLEVTIMDERFVACVPSFTAAGAHCLARLMLRKGVWTPAHVYYSEYTFSQLQPLVSTMLACCDDPLKHHQAVFEKYGDRKFKRASFFVQSELDKGFMVPSIPRSSTTYEEGELENDWRSKQQYSFV